MSALEDELATAAQLGQQILLRHDRHVEKTTAERQVLLLEIERQAAHERRAAQLEEENRLLEQQNHDALQDNFGLIKRLEALNAALQAADVRNHDLLTTLTEAEGAVDQLAGKALDAQSLKQQVSSVQLEKEALEQQVATLTHDHEGSDARCRKAQRKIEELERQLQDMAHQAMEVGNLDTSRRVLVTPARLRAADPAAAPKIVADLVQQNAALTLSAAELRKMLADAQDELQRMRHDASVMIQTHEEADEPQTLRQTISQELHHHHHHHYYHVPDKTSRKRPSQARIRASSPVASFATPAPLHTHAHGLASPESLVKPSRRGVRDSGYFSLSRDRSSSYSHPSTPFTVMTSEDDSACKAEVANSGMRTPTRFHQRAQSHHLLHSIAATPRAATPGRQRRNSADSILPDASFRQEDAIDADALAEAQQEGFFQPLLRQAASHESLLQPPRRQTGLLPADRLLARNPSGMMPRRPFPVPLQPGDGPAARIVSADLTTALGVGYRRASGSPRTGKDSYVALLRTAVAAQRQTSGQPSVGAGSGVAGTANAPGGLFWRRSSGTGVPQDLAGKQREGPVTADNARQRSSKWLGKLWHGAGPPPPAVVSPLLAPGKDFAAQEAIEAVLEPVHVDEDLLKEALGL